MCERSELVNISWVFNSFSQTRHLTVGLSQLKSKLDSKTWKMTRQFRREKRGQNGNILGEISYCAVCTQGFPGHQVFASWSSDQIEIFFSMTVGRFLKRPNNNEGQVFSKGKKENSLDFRGCLQSIILHLFTTLFTCRIKVVACHSCQKPSFYLS